MPIAIELKLIQNILKIMLNKVIKGFLILAMFSVAFLGTGAYQEYQSFETPASYVHKIYNVAGGSGSAVVIGPNLVLTAAHVADQRELFINGKRAKLVKIDKEKDLALMEVDISCPCAPIGKDVNIGDSVLAIGWPLGATEFATYGKVQGFDTFRVWTSTSIAPGNSGGGLFSFQWGSWKLVGITVEVAAFSDGFIGIPINHMARSVPVQDILYFIHHEASK